MRGISLEAILLAAGGSSRLGTSKQLVRMDGESLVLRAARLLLGLELNSVTVVTGAEARPVASELQKLPVNLVHNAHWQRGMGTSLAVAADLLPENLDGVLIMLCDQWRLIHSDLAKLVAAWQADQSEIVVSQWRDASGPPVIFPSRMFGQLRALEGDRGAKAVIEKNRDRVAYVSIDNAAFDLDSPGDLLRGFGLSV